MVSIVGELHFRQAGHEHTARLDENLRWNCDDLQLEQFLNQACSIPPATGDIDARRSVIHGIYQTAERLGAEVTVRPQK